MYSETPDTVVVPASSDGYYSQTQKTSGPIIGMNANSEIMLEASTQPPRLDKNSVYQDDQNFVQQPFTSQGLVNSENNMLQENHDIPHKASSYTSYTHPIITNDDNGSKSGIQEPTNMMSTPCVQSAQNQEYVDQKIEGNDLDNVDDDSNIVRAGNIAEKPQTTHQQRQKPNFITSRNDDIA